MEGAEEREAQRLTNGTAGRIGRDEKRSGRLCPRARFSTHPIRDALERVQLRVLEREPDEGDDEPVDEQQRRHAPSRKEVEEGEAVSYTHLTLPTIYSV